jgi:hypothetical protein
MRKTLITLACLAVLAVASYYAGGRELLEVLSWHVG